MTTRPKARIGNTVLLSESAKPHQGHTALVEAMDRTSTGILVYICKCQCGRTRRIKSSQISRVLSPPVISSSEGVLVLRRPWSENQIPSYTPLAEQGPVSPSTWTDRLYGNLTMLQVSDLQRIITDWVKSRTQEDYLLPNMTSSSAVKNLAEYIALEWVRY